ncbi:MAG: hypothetical protein ACRC0Y_03865 [Fusobacteriaceae bacterium]
MTKAEIKKHNKELLILSIERCIGGTIDKLNNKDKKLVKDITSKDLESGLYTLEYIKQQYYSWEVESSQYNVEANLGRLVYLFNQNYDMCSEMLEVKEINSIETNCEFRVKKVNDIKSYEDLAQEVGL